MAAGAPTAEALGIPARRAQGYEGTDRQARGRLLAVLRDAAAPVPDAVLRSACPDAEQAGRALASLLDDGLVAAVTGGYALPG